MEPQYLLIPLLLCLIPLFGFWIIWRFIFGRSTKRVLMAIIATLLNRQDTIDPDAPIPIPKKDMHISDMMDDMANDTRQFEAQLAPVQKSIPRAPLSPAEQDSDNQPAMGRIGRSLRRLRRPFRHIRLQTENETLNEDYYHGDT